MRIIRTIVFVAVTTIPAFGQNQTATNDSTNKSVHEIMALRSRYVEAEEKKDMPFLEKVFGKDLFELNAQGQVLDRVQMLDNLRRSTRSLGVGPARDVRVKLYGSASVAVLTELVTVSGEDKGHKFGGDFRFVRIFERRQGRWQIVLVQGTPVPSQMVSGK